MREKTVKFQREALPFTQIANAALRDKRMSLAVRGFFALLLSLPDDKPHAISYFAKVGNISTETVYKYFRILEDLGYLTREQQHENGKFGTNIYVFHQIPEPKPYRNLPNTAEPNTENPDTKEITLGKNIPPIVPQGDACDEMFNRFWALYPRKGKKQAARRAWDKLKPDRALCSQMSRALKAQMRSEDWQREGGRYIPYPSSWLNGRRWEDETPSAPPPPPPEPPTREEDRWLQ